MLMIVSSLAMATSLYAVSYIVPADRELIGDAEAIFSAQAVSSHAELTSDGRVVTIAELTVDDVMKGPIEPGTTLRLTEAGGIVGNYGVFIPGAPRYEPGRRYLVFAGRSKFGGWSTYALGLGKFTIVQDLGGRDILLRGDDAAIFGFGAGDFAPHAERLRLGDEFRTYVRTVVAGGADAARTDYFIDRNDVILAHFVSATAFRPMPLTTRADYLGSNLLRWKTPSTTMVYCCGVTPQPSPLDGVDAFNTALIRWNTAGAGISYGNGGRDDTATGGLSGFGRGNDHHNAVLFNDPFNDLPNPNGGFLIGVGGGSGWSYIGPDGQTYFGPDIPGNPAGEVDVEINDGLGPLGQTRFSAGVSHEVGHTLGFRHSDMNAQDSGPCSPPAPCSSSAIMVSFINADYQGLQQWDLDAANTVYGAGPVCNAPSIQTQPSSQSIALGAQANLSVVASGTGTLTYQWYTGTSPSTGSPVGGATSATFHPTPATTTSYWVQVTNTCPGSPTNSSTAVVTVTCTAPSAPAPSAVPSTIASGQSSTISETPTGSGPFTYQWYVGNTGVTTTPIGGATNSSVSVSPTTTTSYWVRVTGQCAPPSDSPAAQVTVAPCVPPSAPTPIASPTSVPSGQTSTIVVNPSGTSPFTYQWYIGNSPSTTAPINGATNSFVSVNPTVTTTYWVRVTGQCSPPANSPDVTVTVTCSPINGNPSAAPSTINPGQSSTLAVATSGAGPFTFQWYNGNPGDTSSPLAGANGQSTPVSPVTTSIYWVRVTSPCGTQDAGVTVNVNGVCNPPSIATQPASSTISANTPVILTVSAGGTAPFSYQWFTGDKGDISHPISGATSFSLTQSPASTTKYWVRVSHTCDSQTADSNAATITVTVVTCTNPSITTQPANVTVGIGSTATLKVVAAGSSTLHYQWFEGVKGDTSKPRGTDSATLVTAVIKATTSFWVHVTNQCANGTPADSNAATVTAAIVRIHAVRH